MCRVGLVTKKKALPDLRSAWRSTCLPLFFASTSFFMGERARFPGRCVGERETKKHEPPFRFGGAAHGACAGLATRRPCASPSPIHITYTFFFFYLRLRV